VQTLLAAVVRSPDDIDLRGIWADHMEEAGLVERAAFVRAQLATTQTESRGQRCSQAEYVQRLLKRYARRWFRALDFETLLIYTNDLSYKWKRRICLPNSRSDDELHLFLRWGSVDEIQCSESWWLRRGRRLRPYLPLRHVTFQGKHPLLSSDGYSWLSGPSHGSAFIHYELYERIWGLLGSPAYPTPDDALDALSRGLLRISLP
jgi:uncharacterized protein (TIGR02996 family)